MVRVYIHGRPQGQDIWSQDPISNDNFYLEPFLGSRIGEGMYAVMQVDMWQNNAYYSYIHRQNVFEYGNRPGAYFAITVCFDGKYCTNVATLYQLLETIFEKLCKNAILERTCESERFLVSHFLDKEDLMRQITNVIQQNVEKFLANSLTSIEGNPDTTKLQLKSYSTEDVDSPKFLSDCKSYRILISPSFVEKDRIAVELKQEVSRIEAQKLAITNERDRWQADAERLNSENGDLKQNGNDLRNQVRNLQAQISSVQDSLQREYNTKLKKYQEEVQRTQNNLSQLQRQNQSLEGQIVTLNRQMAATKTIGNPKGNGNEINDNSRRWAGRFLNSGTLFSCLNLAMLIAVIALLNMGHTKIGNDVSAIDTKVSEFRTQLSGLQETISKIGSSKTTTQATKKDTSTKASASHDYSKASINIVRYSGRGTLEVGKIYTVTLKVVNPSPNVHWEITGAAELRADGTSFEVKRDGEIVIRCLDASNKEINNRTVQAATSSNSSQIGQQQGREAKQEPVVPTSNDSTKSNAPSPVTPDSVP